MVPCSPKRKELISLTEAEKAENVRKQVFRGNNLRSRAARHCYASLAGTDSLASNSLGRYQKLAAAMCYFDSSIAVVAKMPFPHSATSTLGRFQLENPKLGKEILLDWFSFG